MNPNLLAIFANRWLTTIKDVQNKLSKFSDLIFLDNANRIEPLVIIITSGLVKSLAFNI